MEAFDPEVGFDFDFGLGFFAGGLVIVWVGVGVW